MGGASKHLALVAEDLGPGARLWVAAQVRALAVSGIRCSILAPLESWSRALAEVRGVRVVPPSSGREALERLHAEDPIDAVEIPDRDGLGFEALRAREQGTWLAGVGVWVRAQGTQELRDQVSGVPLGDPGRAARYARERLALKLADSVLVPSPSIGELYRHAYGLERDRIHLAPPAVEAVLAGLHPPLRRLPDEGHFLFYAREPKEQGLDTFLEAATSLVTEEPGRHWRFTVAGVDPGEVAPLIPRRYSEAFELLPAFDREQLAALSFRVRAGLAPSRFDTFALEAHEMLAVGLPVVVSRAPGLRDTLHADAGCLPFDGSANGLREAILQLREDEVLAESLSRRPLPRYGSAVEPYRQLFEAGGPVQRGEVERALLTQQLGALTSGR